MMPESANPVEQSLTIIEIRPYRGDWQCYEGPGVGPYWIGDTAKEDAIGYAAARAKFGRSRRSESHRPCQIVAPSDLNFEIGHVLFVPSLAAKESARDGCALPVESRLNG